ncbi:MAG: hypothetical protein SO401_00415 [Blautia sp.]|nr:hypothetical protein [Blautia sp.]
MNQIIEEIYESESKRSTELKRMDEEFEKQLNQLVESLMQEISENDRETVTDQIFKILLPVKKQVFCYGFKTAMMLWRL